MKCQVCNQNEATVQVTDIEGSEKRVSHLCEECAPGKSVLIPKPACVEFKCPKCGQEFNLQPPECSCPNCGIKFRQEVLFSRPGFKKVRWHIVEGGSARE